MPLKLLHTDLTQFPCDALVLSTDESMHYGGSVFGAACSIAGPSMHDLLREIDGCEIGHAKVIRNFDAIRMQCGKIIITAAPIWKDGHHGEPELLASCYHSALKEAAAMKCKTVGIGLIDSGIYGFPKDAAREIAVQALLEDPFINKMNVFLITFDWSSYQAHMKQAAELERYLNLKYRKETNKAVGNFGTYASQQGFGMRKGVMQRFVGNRPAFDPSAQLDERLQQLDEGFSEMLLRKIDEAGIKDSECYKRANISRQVFSKIRSKKDYKPKKETVIALALALEMNLDDTNALLRTLGYALSHSDKSDVVIEYFISHGVYNVFVINEALHRYDLQLLGSD